MAPSKGDVGGVPCHRLGTPHQGSGKGQGFLSSRMGMGFIPAFSAFLYIMGHGLVPRLISQSPCYGNARVHWFCISCPPAETPQLWEPPRLSWSFKLSQRGREGAGDRSALRPAGRSVFWTEWLTAGLGGSGGHFPPYVSLEAMQLSSSSLPGLSVAL